MRTFSKPVKKIIFIFPALLIILLLAVLCINRLNKIAFTGSIDITFLSENAEYLKAARVIAYSPDNVLILPSCTGNRYSFNEQHKSYGNIAVSLPASFCKPDIQIEINYHRKIFAFSYHDIIKWRKTKDKSNTAFFLPDTVSRMTSFADKNSSLIYNILISFYFLGLHRYISQIMILLVVLLSGLLLMEFFIKRRSKNESSEFRIINYPVLGFLKWLVVTAIILSFAAHLLLIFFGIIFSTTGPVLMTIMFAVMIVISRFIFKRQPSLRKNLTLYFGVLYFCLMTVEIFLRLSGITTTYLERRDGFYQSPYKPQETGWYHVWSPNSKHYLETGEYRFIRQTNSLGLSDKEFETGKTPGEYRIIGLGDSFTEGDGAERDSSWMKFLERRFRQQFPDRNVTFYNAGVCGSDPFFEYVLLRDKLIRFKPDLVVAAFNNEVPEIMVRGGMERFLPDGTCRYKKPPSWETWYAYSHIFRLIIHKLFNYDYSLMRPDVVKKEKEKAIRLFENSITLFDKLAIKNNFNLLVVIHPNKSEVNNRTFDYLGRIIKACKIQNVECLDMLDYYNNLEHIGKNCSQFYFWENDGHHNATGYAAFARGVEWKLKQMGITDTIKSKRYEK